MCIRDRIGTLALASEAHVRGDREVREEPIVLWQVANATALRRQADPLSDVEPDLAAEHDPSLARAFEAGNRSQQRRLAGARGADQRDRLAAGAQRRAKVKRAPGEDDVDVEEVHFCPSSLAVRRIAALTMISSTPIEIASSMLTSNSE